MAARRGFLPRKRTASADKEAVLATTPELHEPQIAAARAAAWHQAGDAVLTLEAARTWLNEYGLVLFAPRGASLGAPMPSFVEATLGAAKPTVALAETETARGLVARLVGEGSALPLNLLGGPGDLPDFVVSAQTFPFVFTLRGDKGWKRPPETSGAVKVTPLGLRVYELLAEKGAMTIADMVPEIGREVTESAIARALNELWQLLRVIPVLQQGEGETLWELTTTRFLKAVKAGANAGQPTALSALVSLYLTQVFVASEEETAGFLSPLTARSRVREVLHGLIAGRQLAEGVVNGKAVLYVPDALPDFAAFAEPDADEAEEDSAEVSGETTEGEQAADGEAGAEAPKERIRRFAGEGAAAKDRNFRGKPLNREGAAGRGASDRPRREGSSRGPQESRGPREGGAERRPFAPRTDRADRADRPVRRDGDAERPARRAPAGDRPSFAKPWDEERGSRPPRRNEGERPFRPRTEGAGGSDRPARTGDDRRPPRRDFGGGERPAFRRRDAGDGQERGAGPRGDRPFRARPEGGGDRPFRPRSSEGGDRPFRARPAAGGDRPYRPRPEGGGDRPFRPRPEGGGDRPYRPRPEGGDRPFRPRSAEGGDRPFRARPAGGGDRPFRPRPEGGGDRPFRPRSAEGGDRPYRPRPEGGGDRPFRPRTEGGGDRPFRPRPAGGGGDRPYRSREGGDAGEGRPSRRPPFAGRSEGGAPRGARPGGFGDRKGPRPGGPGGFGPKKPGFKSAGFKKAPGKFAGRTDRPARPARKPRPEDEA